jgi:hypothetical protein
MAFVVRACMRYADCRRFFNGMVDDLLLLGAGSHRSFSSMIARAAKRRRSSWEEI